MGFFSNIFNKEKSSDAITHEPNASTHETGEENLASLIKQTYVKDKNSAYSMTWQIVSMARMDYSVNVIVDDMPSFPSDDKNPVLLQKYLDKVLEDHGMCLKDEYSDMSPELDFNKINIFLKSLTNNISDPEIKLQINYLIAESIIKEWDLDK